MIATTGHGRRAWPLLLVAAAAACAPRTCAAGAVLQATIELDSGQNPTPFPGDAVNLVLSLHNVGDAATGDGFSGFFDTCFEWNATSGAHCAPPVLTASDPRLYPDCFYNDTGFWIMPWTLAADDGAPGGPDELVLHVVTHAGSAPGPCTITFGGGGSPCPPACATVTSSLTIAPGDCRALYADVSSAPPLPPRTGDWVYTEACTSGNTLPLANVAASAIRGDNLLGEPATGLGGSLRLYDLQCGCPGHIALVKEGAAELATLRLRVF